MTVYKRQLDDKLELFKLTGFTQTGSGWDYAIPQSAHDQLTAMGIDHPGAWFMMNCSSRPWSIHHIGEAYAMLLRHRSDANGEVFNQMFAKQYEEGDSPEAIACEKAFYRFFCDDDDIRSEADCGLIKIDQSLRSFMAGVEFEEKRKNQFLLQSAWSDKRESEQRFCFVIRTKEYACSGTNYVVHMMTADGGFHHGDYTDSAEDALARFIERCKLRNLSPLPLVNEN